MEIEVGEYVRTRLGDIIKANIDYENLTITDKGISFNFGDISKMSSFINDEIVKHSKNIIDLIEAGDILELKEDNDIVYIGLKQDTITLSYKELLESIERGECKLLSILTHEQYEQNCYKL